MNNQKNEALQHPHRDVVLTYAGDHEAFLVSRIEKGLTQAELSKLIGVKGDDTINNIEIGVYDVEDRTYSLFCLATDSHPYYDLVSKGVGSELIIEPPSGESIKQMRLSNNNMTQRKMAKLLSLSSHNIISKYEKGIREPSDANWSLFLLITNNHPYYSITPKKSGGHTHEK